MQTSFVRRARQGLVLTALATTLGLASCQNMNAFVTGEQFYRAPEGSARMEVELVVNIQDDFYANLDDETAQQELEAEIKALVLSHADVGMRFYPIRSGDYGKDDVRPAYVMFVNVEQLTIDANHETVEVEGEPSHVESTVRALDCTVQASVEKRRDNAPPLRVGTGEGVGRVHVTKASEDRADEGTYHVKRSSDEHEAMDVTHADIMAVVEETVVDALRKVIRPIDRDFELDRAEKP